ncbi:MAG: 3-hydroxyacyl-CoA dehydrogenase NAD-binding domain-containing protein [bacterium]|nr:3-hydroxyacyl-CoA dehydrogenase NAD-binding domain-containing protein [bacterium]
MEPNELSSIINEKLRSGGGALNPPDSESITDFLRIVVVGVGTMGQGIAQNASQVGIDVLLIEKNQESLKASIAGIEENINHEISRWAKTESDKKAIMSRIVGSVDFSDAADKPLVIEALPDNLELKKTVFSRLDKICNPDTVFITNTSTLSVTEIAAATDRERRVIGLHFLNPVTKTSVVEVVRGLKTSNRTFERIRHFAVQLNKTPIEVFEYPGYVTTRIILPMINEAMYVLMEGVASAEGIDTALKLGYNMELGPLALADQMGLDEVMIWMESLFRELGDLKYRPCPLLRKMVRAGHLGKKTDRGFFNYDENGRIIRKGVAE